jgi:hypothetical protein
MTWFEKVSTYIIRDWRVAAMLLSLALILIWRAWRYYMTWMIRHETSNLSEDVLDMVRTRLRAQAEAIEDLQGRVRRLAEHQQRPQTPAPPTVATPEPQAPAAPARRGRKRKESTPAPEGQSWLDRLREDDDES